MGEWTHTLSKAESDEAQGRFVEALKGYSAVLVAEPAEPRAMLGLGRIRLLLGEVDRALEDFTAVLVHDPNNAEAYRGRGLVFLNQGLTGHAVRDLSRAVELAPDALEPRLSRGLAALDLQDVELASRDLRIALTLAPTDPDVVLALAECVASTLTRPVDDQRLGELEELLATVHQEVGDDAQHRLLMSVAELARGRRVEARTKLLAALADDPELRALAKRLPLLVELEVADG